MNLPEDVQLLLEQTIPREEFGEALLVLGQARIEDGTAPSPRLLRCAAFACGGNLKRLRDLASLMAVDWREVVMAGEYELQDEVAVRVRDLSQPLRF